MQALICRSNNSTCNTGKQVRLISDDSTRSRNVDSTVENDDAAFNALVHAYGVNFDVRQLAKHKRKMRDHIDIDVDVDINVDIDVDSDFDNDVDIVINLSLRR